MENATIIVTNYKSSYARLNGNIDAHISKIDIARGIVSIGKTHWNQYLTSPTRSLIDFLHYWTGLVPFLNERPDLSLTADFASLDMTDKGQKSYLIGMGLARIAAERILNIPYLQHVDSLIAKGIIKVVSGSNERGDLVGLDRNLNWHVIEAKGRSNTPSAEDRRKAKKQAEKISSIAGKAPETKSYCITHIDQISCEIYLNDPDDDPIEKLDLEINSDSFIKEYYDKIFKDFYNEKESMILSFTDQDINFSLFRLGDGNNGNIYLGLESKILNDLRQQKVSFSESLVFRERGFNIFSNLNIANLSIGIDGILLFQDEDRLLETNASISYVDGNTVKLSIKPA